CQNSFVLSSHFGAKLTFLLKYKLEFLFSQLSVVLNLQLEYCFNNFGISLSYPICANNIITQIKCLFSPSQSETDFICNMNTSWANHMTFNIGFEFSRIGKL